MSRQLKEIGRPRIPFIFKSSYDKATAPAASPSAAGMDKGSNPDQGEGDDRVPVLTDVHMQDSGARREVVDVLRRPRSCPQRLHRGVASRQAREHQEGQFLRRTT